MGHVVPIGSRTDIPKAIAIWRCGMTAGFESRTPAFGAFGPLPGLGIERVRATASDRLSNRLVVSRSALAGAEAPP